MTKKEMLLSIVFLKTGVYDLESNQLALIFPFLFSKLRMGIYIYIYIYIYTECPGGNVPDFGRLSLKLKYADLTQNTYIQS